jgi:hypothetical protein
MVKKYVGILLLIAVFCISCRDVQHYFELNKTTSPDTVGFYAARNLAGLGGFLIGKSTYSQTLEDLKNEWRKDDRYYYFNYGKGLGENFSGLREVKYDSANTLEANSIFPIRFIACKDVKIIGCYDYYLGDIEITDLALTFYKDTLIRIDCRQSDKLDQDFALKYGSDKVKSETVWFTPSGRTKIQPDKELLKKGSADVLSNFSERIWENQEFKAISYARIKYKYENKKFAGTDYKINEFSIVSKNEVRNGKMIRCDSISKTNIEMSSQKSGNIYLNN